VPKLVLRLSPFYSPTDEAHFFAWLGSIKGVTKLAGHLRDLHITLARAPSDTALSELIALCQRYRIGMRPLAAFRTARNARWLADPKAYWHRAMFKPSRR
jgi:hypothetical protein